MILGAVIQEKGWRWGLWVQTIFAGAFLILMFFFLPETLYVSVIESSTSKQADLAHRYVRHLNAEALDQDPETRPKRKRLFAQLSFGRISPKPISFLEFFRPLYMLRYPSVGLIAFAWCLSVAMPDIGISNIVPLAFGEVYGWSPAAQGLSNAGFLVGCIIGEAFAGKVSDIVRSPSSPVF